MHAMTFLARGSKSSASRFGDMAVLGFLLVQGLDGALTYLGVRIWGVGIEGNPLIASAMSAAGPVVGLTGFKLFAVCLGIALHLKHVHNLIALLTVIYFAAAILPWTAVFLTH